MSYKDHFSFNMENGPWRAKVEETNIAKDHSA